ncbi:MAG: GSCFA domain-containing protein [Bacteroidales bacterium]|nr:GSCFA domain-containing protein [Bacteroidales bacterium]
MLKLQTPVTDEPCKTGISYNDKIMMLGSCFTDNIGKMLSDYGFDVCVNPFGALYNPVSVLNSIERLASCRKFTEEDCVLIGAGDERICSFHHHTSFARESVEEFLSEANEALQKASEHFLASNRIIITLGTSWCFRHISKDFIVSNCLKHPAAEFRRERLSVKEVAEALRRITELSVPGMQPKEFIFTVSPIRHFKDGAHGNQISKSTLLLGIEDVLEDCRADYFPAYEIVNDELRDYRFYAEDMCHPSDQTIRYIFERFVSWALPASEHQTLEQNIKTYLRSRHRQQHI